MRRPQSPPPPLECSHFDAIHPGTCVYMSGREPSWLLGQQSFLSKLVRTIEGHRLWGEGWPNHLLLQVNKGTLPIPLPGGGTQASPCLFSKKQQQPSESNSTYQISTDFKSKSLLLFYVRPQLDSTPNSSLLREEVISFICTSLSTSIVQPSLPKFQALTTSDFLS